MENVVNQLLKYIIFALSIIMISSCAINKPKTPSKQYVADEFIDGLSIEDFKLTNYQKNIKVTEKVETSNLNFMACSFIKNERFDMKNRHFPSLQDDYRFISGPNLVTDVIFYNLSKEIVSLDMYDCDEVQGKIDNEIKLSSKFSNCFQINGDVQSCDTLFYWAKSICKNRACEAMGYFSVVRMCELENPEACNLIKDLKIDVKKFETKYSNLNFKLSKYYAIQLRTLLRINEQYTQKENVKKLFLIKNEKCDHGNADLCWQIYKKLTVENDHANAFSFLEKACSFGNPNACVVLKTKNEKQSSDEMLAIERKKIEISNSNENYHREKEAQKERADSYQKLGNTIQNAFTIPAQKTNRICTSVMELGQLVTRCRDE